MIVVTVVQDKNKSYTFTIVFFLFVICSGNFHKRFEMVPNVLQVEDPGT
jgi:hypothetical protein